MSCRGKNSVRDKSDKWIYLERYTLPGGASGKELTCQCRRFKRLRFHPWVRKIPLRRAWQPTPIFLPGESQGQRSLVDYSPNGRKESDAIKRLSVPLGRRDLPCGSVVKTVLPMQGARVLALVRELDPAHHN